jgi:DNA-binding transcriptional MerR regulator
VFKKIEEVSKLSGVSKRTLQYYDDEGILPVKRSKNNYRLYDDETMERLWEVLWYKEMGFDLKEITLILEGVKQETVIEEKVNKINNTIRVLEEQKKVIKYIQRYSIPTKSEENNKTYKDQIKQIRKEQGM